MHTGRRTIIKTLKELGAVRLANALAQRTDSHSVLHECVQHADSAHYDLLSNISFIPKVTLRS